MPGCLELSLSFYVPKQSEINTADDAAARLVKDNNKCVEIEAGQARSGVLTQAACCWVCLVYEFIYQPDVLQTSGGKTNRFFSIERETGMRNALTEWEWRSVRVNMELLKYLPRPVGGLQGNQCCYSGKLADAQNHLELIMACVCTSARACAHINTHQQTWRRTQTWLVCTVCIHTPTCLHTHTDSHTFVQ